MLAHGDMIGCSAKTAWGTVLANERCLCLPIAQPRPRGVAEAAGPGKRRRREGPGATSNARGLESLAGRAWSGGGPILRRDTRSGCWACCRRRHKGSSDGWYGCTAGREGRPTERQVVPMNGRRRCIWVRARPRWGRGRASVWVRARRWASGGPWCAEGNRKKKRRARDVQR